MTEDQAEQLIALAHSIAESLRILCNAVESAAERMPWEEEG